MAADLAIIIVTWNARDWLLRCLASLPAGAAGLEVETWVVDNASTDGTVEAVAHAFPQVHLIANNANLGFAAANNQAAAQSNSRFLLLLNPDTEVPPDMLRGLATYADEHPSVGAVGPQLRNLDGSPQRSCWRGYPDLAMALTDALYLWKLPWLPLAQRSEYQPAELSAPRPVDHLLGACLLIRRRAWEQVGPLDAGYFLFLEETDWCRRAQRAGWDIVYHPQFWITHAGQHSMRQAPAANLPHLYRSFTRFYRQHSGGRGRVLLLKLIFALAILVRFGLWGLRWLRSPAARSQARQMLHGYGQVLRLLPGL